MSTERVSKKDRRAEARERARIAHERELRAKRRNRIFVRIGVTLGVLALLAGVGGGVYAATRPEAPGPVNMLSGGAVFTGGGGETQIVETAGMPAGSDAVPTDTSEVTAPARIRTYIDFSCEYCKMFEDANGEQIEQLVASGQATLEVVPVAILGDYSVRAASAASCMAALQPTSFFDMLTVMYAQQPAEGGSGYSNQEILDLWTGGGIQPSAELSQCVTDTRYDEWIAARTNAVTSDPAIQNPATGSFGTPTVFVNDVRYQPTALGDPQEFADFVAANSAPTDGTGS